MTGGVTGSTFENNTVLSLNEGAFGGAIAVSIVQGTFTGDISDSTFTGNNVQNDGSATFLFNVGAFGGAAFIPFLDGDIKNSTFTDNRAKSTNGRTLGGAIFTHDYDGTISGSTFEQNKAEATNGEGFGGALFIGGQSITGLASTTTISDSSFKDNSASTHGGAIYLSSYGFDEDRNLIITATAGKETIFQGNTDSSGANSIHVGSAYTADAADDETNRNTNITVSGAGTVSLYDPISVDMDNNINGHNFAFTRDNSLGNGVFNWGGKNTFSVAGGGSATVNFTSGTTNLQEDFTIISAAGTPLHVTLGATHRTNLNIDRSQTLAVFNFTSADIPNSSLVLENGTTLVLSSPGKNLIHSLTPFTGRYLVADGLSATSAAVNGVTLAQTDETKYRLDNTNPNQLWLDVSYNPVLPPNPSPNVKPDTGLLPLDQWLKETEEGRRLSDNQFLALKHNLASATPETALTLGIANTELHNRVVSAAYRNALAASVNGQNCALNIYSDMTNSNRNSANSDCDPLKQTFVWASYFGDTSRMDAHGGYTGYKADTHGILAGITHRYDSLWTFGGYAGYTITETEFKRMNADADSDGAHIGAFARYTPNDFRFTTDIAWSQFNNDLKRNPAFIGTSLSEFDQNLFSFGFETSYNFKYSDNMHIEPFAAARYTHLRQDSFREENGPLRSNVGSINADSVATTLGLRLAHRYQYSEDTAFTSAASLGWKHEFGDRQLSTLTNFSAQNILGNRPLDYTVRSLQLDRDFAVGGISFQTEIKGKTQDYIFRVGYNFELSENNDNHTAAVLFGIKF